MTRALLINPGDRHCILVEVDGNDLAAMQKLVGGWLEGLPMPMIGAQALINEEGKLQRLPVNELATSIAKGTESLQPGDTINGPMVIVSVGADGATGDVPERVLAALATAGVDVVQEER